MSLKTETDELNLTFSLKTRLLKKKLKTLIEKLPDNSKTKPLGSKCFAISSSEMTKANNWSPNYHSFKGIFNHLINVIEKKSLFKIRAEINGIINLGVYIDSTDKNRIKDVHPEARKLIEDLWESN